MWINPMLTIWLYGTIFSLAVIVLTLYVWYWRKPGQAPARHADGDDRRASQRGRDDAAQ